LGPFPILSFFDDDAEEEEEGRRDSTGRGIRMRGGTSAAWSSLGCLFTFLEEEDDDDDRRLGGGKKKRKRRRRRAFKGNGRVDVTGPAHVVNLMGMCIV